MLKMKDVGKVYRTDMVQTSALRDFNLTVDEGEFVAVTGPSGSGKTTFLNIAGLLEGFDGGSYELDGADVSRLGDDARSRIRNEKIGFIFQGFNLIADLNVFDNVDVPLRYRGFKAAERQKRIRESLELVGLASRFKHLPAAVGRTAAARRDRALARRQPALPAGRRADRQPRLGDGATGHGTARGNQRPWHDHHHGDARPRARPPRASQPAHARRAGHGLHRVRGRRARARGPRGRRRRLRRTTVFAYHLRLALLSLWRTPSVSLLMILAIGLAVAAGLVAGLYPAWRICRTQPAACLKTQ